MNQTDNTDNVLELASEAGHILLQNGAEISRVEDTMARIAAHYGVETGNFFVLSNGIFTTSSPGRYAKVEFIPIRAIQLSKVVAVNKLSFDIAAGKYTLEQAREELERIKAGSPKPAWEQIAGSAFGAAGFCAVFGGSFIDCAADFVIGALLYVFCLYFSERYMSKIVGGICNALIATLLSIVAFRLGAGESLSNIIIGAVMPLIPGVPYVNGVRDLVNSDYIAGLTRLTDAMLGFFCIAIGVSIAFMLDGWAAGGIIELHQMSIHPSTAGLGWQFLAAFIGTFAFAILFGSPRKQYFAAGIIGALGWAAYLLMVRALGSSAFVAILIATALVCILIQICSGITQMSEHSIRALRNLPSCAWSRRVLVYLLFDFQPIPPVGNDRFHCHEGSTRHRAWYRIRHGTASADVLRTQKTALTSSI